MQEIRHRLDGVDVALGHGPEARGAESDAGVDAAQLDDVVGVGIPGDEVPSLGDDELDPRVAQHVPHIRTEDVPYRLRRDGVQLDAAHLRRAFMERDQHVGGAPDPDHEHPGPWAEAIDRRL